MAEMEWSRLLDLEPLYRPDRKTSPRRPAFDQDADRITFSAPFIARPIFICQIRLMVQEFLFLLKSLLIDF